MRNIFKATENTINFMFALVGFGSVVRTLFHLAIKLMFSMVPVFY